MMGTRELELRPGPASASLAVCLGPVVQPLWPPCSLSSVTVQISSLPPWLVRCGLWAVGCGFQRVERLEANSWAPHGPSFFLCQVCGRPGCEVGPVMQGGVELRKEAPARCGWFPTGGWPGCCPEPWPPWLPDSGIPCWVPAFLPCSEPASMPTFKGLLEVT